MIPQHNKYVSFNLEDEDEEAVHDLLFFSYTTLRPTFNYAHWLQTRRRHWPARWNTSHVVRLWDLAHRYGNPLLCAYLVNQVFSPRLEATWDCKDYCHAVREMYDVEKNYRSILQTREGNKLRLWILRVGAQHWSELEGSRHLRGLVRNLVFYGYRAQVLHFLRGDDVVYARRDMEEAAEAAKKEAERRRVEKYQTLWREAEEAVRPIVDAGRRRRAVMRGQTETKREICARLTAEWRVEDKRALDAWAAVQPPPAKPELCLHKMNRKMRQLGKKIYNSDRGNDYSYFVAQGPWGHWDALRAVNWYPLAGESWLYGEIESVDPLDTVELPGRDWRGLNFVNWNPPPGGSWRIGELESIDPLDPVEVTGVARPCAVESGSPVDTAEVTGAIFGLEWARIKPYSGT